MPKSKSKSKNKKSHLGVMGSGITTQYTRKGTIDYKPARKEGMGSKDKQVPKSPNSMSAGYGSEDRSGDFSPSPQHRVRLTSEHSPPSTPQQHKKKKGGKPYKRISKRRKSKRRISKRRKSKRRISKRQSKRSSKRGKMYDFGDFDNYQFQSDMLNQDPHGDPKLKQAEGKVSHNRSYEHKRKKGKPTDPPSVIIDRHQFKKRYN